MFSYAYSGLTAYRKETSDSFHGAEGSHIAQSMELLLGSCQHQNCNCLWELQ